MTRKIMLIKPAYETDAVWDTIRTSHPLGLWWIGSALKERGHEVRLLDETVRNGGLEKRLMFRREVDGEISRDVPSEISYQDFQSQKLEDFNNLSPEEFAKKYSAFRDNKVVRDMVRTGNTIEETLREIGEMRPDFVGIPIFASCNYPAALTLARAIRNYYPNVKIVMGGQHATAQPKEVLASGADYVITGDAVHAMIDLVERGSEMGMVFGKVSDIGSFPLLDMSLMAENQYPLRPTHTYDTQGRKSVDYMFSKGCFRSCEFCVAGEKENKISTTRLEQIDAQLERFVQAGIEEIIVQDDAFLFKPQTNLKSFLALMKKHGLYWQDNGGIEFEGLNPAVMDMLREYQTSGRGRINSLYVPLNPRTGTHTESALRDMKMRFATHFPHIKELRELGIYVCTSEIIGYPGQTMNSMSEDVALHQLLVQEGYVDKSMTFVTSTLPGTKLHREHHQNIINPLDWAAYSNFVPQSRTENVSDVRDIERMTAYRNRRMNEVQRSYSWGSTFPNT
jgi:radical SAM superfamily enzyme YgiQ (UPF0313 family)